MSQPPEQVWYERLSPAQQYSGVRVGMITIGIILICVGAFCACSGAMMPVVLLAQTGAQPAPPVPHPVRLMIGVTVLYFVLAAAVIFVAIGTLRCQRWARPVMIVISAQTLLGGIAAMFVFAVGYPDFVRQMNQTGGPPAADPIMYGSMVGFTFLCTVVVPGIFLWFFARARVAEALVALDPNPRWTDGVPLPVLAISLTFAMWSVGTCIGAIFGELPMFGTVLVGVAAAVVMLVQGMIEGLIARATFRRSAASWWATLTYAIFYSIAIGSTAIRSDQLALYRRAGYTEEQLKQLDQLSSLHGPMTPIMIAVFTILAVGFLLYVRKYFGPQSQGSVQAAG